MMSEEVSKNFINVIKNIDDIDAEVTRCLIKLKNFKTVYPDETNWLGFETRTENTIDYMIQKLNDTVDLLEETKSKVYER